MNQQQCITILGSTGSIGTSTLDVLSRHPDQYRIHALTASSQVELMLAQCARFKPEVAVMVLESAGRQLAERVKAEGLPVQVRWGTAALDEVACAPQVDAVMAAIVGAAGLSPCIAAARAGKRLMLANKEALVVGGEVFLQAVREGGAVLLPIDSEHSAIFQSLPEDPSTWQRRVQKIILTASGGPFRTRDPRTLKDVTPEQACAHPNWVMGRKISVDSATMMNKALEVIEARYLFGMSPDQLEVVIHPQSVIHSMVQYRDHSVVAQLGTPDMRVPIAYGLSWPERMASGAAALDFHALSAMTFEAMDEPEHRLRYPGIALAWETLRGAPGS
jgi:1-deoxy-D-xylulose-5-phosphate reductoisomerase